LLSRPSSSHYNVHNLIKTNNFPRKINLNGLMCPFTRHTNTKLAIKVVFKRKSPNVNCWKHIRGNLAITSVKTKKIKKIQISLVKNDLIKLTKIFWPSSKIFSRFNFSLSLNDRNLNFPISEAPAHACYVISADQNKKKIFFRYASMCILNKFHSHLSRLKLLVL
jgi:hypothetical protein